MTVGLRVLHVSFFISFYLYFISFVLLEVIWRQHIEGDFLRKLTWPSWESSPIMLSSGSSLSCLASAENTWIWVIAIHRAVSENYIKYIFVYNFRISFFLFLFFTFDRPFRSLLRGRLCGHDDLLRIPTFILDGLLGMRRYHSSKPQHACMHACMSDMYIICWQCTLYPESVMFGAQLLPSKAAKWATSYRVVTDSVVTQHSNTRIYLFFCVKTCLMIQ